MKIIHDDSSHIDFSSIFSKWHPYDRNTKEEAKKYKHVVFFGVGVIFSDMLDIWYDIVDEKIDFCCDNNFKKWGEIYHGIECITYEKLLEIKEDVIIFITVGDFMPVYDQLYSAGFPAVRIIYKYDLQAAPFIRSSNIEKLIIEVRAARNLLCDLKSKSVFDTIIYRSSGTALDIMCMPNISEGSQYFPEDLIELSSDECYVDVGAYDGDTISAFLKKSNNYFNKIYAFELDKNIFLKLKDNLMNNDKRSQINIFNIGAWDSRGEINYHPGNFNSSIGEGKETASVAPLDEYLNDALVTYIKMDIEGAEIQALLGAKKTIESNKPKLAICVYHKISHLWEIPLLIHKMLPDHNIFLRHHTNLEYETVCYALPKNNPPN
jgi:FkbM family methyltransferase